MVSLKVDSKESTREHLKVMTLDYKRVEMKDASMEHQ